MAAGSGDTASKYVARRETPLYIAENCTQCMECIAVCPDTALPNCSQDLETVLRTAVTNYVTDAGERQKMYRSLPEIEKRTREIDARRGGQERQDPAPGHHSRRDERRRRVLARRRRESSSKSSTKCRWRSRRPTRFSRRRKSKTPGAGGVFSIFVSDLCKGCAACVHACGEHQALRMVQETEEVNAEHETGTAFLDLLPDTSQKYLGLYNDTRPQDSQDRDAAQHADGAPELRRARLRRRRVRGLRREEHSQGHHIGHRSVHAADLPREGRSLPGQGR